MPDLVTFAADGPVGTITLCSPPANALAAPVADGIQAALDAAEAAGSKALVVRSGVERFFAAGADIKHMVDLDRDGFDAYLQTLRAAIERLAGFAGVSVAAVDGYAFGGGLELAAACTMRVVARDAQLGVPESKIGLLPGAGGTQRLPRLIGRGRALDLTLTGRPVGGEEAVAIGLADRLTEPGGAGPVALELARELAALSAPALQAIVRCIDAAQSTSFADGMELERQELLELVSDGEVHEGLRAFLDRRAPNFA